MNFQSEEYEIASSLETDLLLVDLPMDLIRAQIRDQINEPLQNNVNYIENVLDFIETFHAQNDGDDDAARTVNNFTVDFFAFIIEEIDTKFDLGINTEAFEMYQYKEVGAALYTFLILQYRRNITKFIQRFIIKNKKMLVDNFDGQIKKKDVTTIAVKKKVKNKDDALIVSNLPTVINSIMNMDIDALTFLKYVGADENHEASMMRNLILEGIMMGNFTRAYMDTIRVDYDQVLDEIQTEVKLKLIKKF